MMAKSVAKTPSHLNKSAREALFLSPSERIKRIQGDRWIGYTRALDIMNKLDELYEYPRVDRMPNLLIIGPSNNGKTMIANRFMRKHPASDNREGNGVIVPVMMVRITAPDENRFYNAILDQVFAPYKPSDSPAKKQSQVVSTLKRIEFRMLIIDDIHDMLAGHLEKQRQFLNVIRFLGNELKVPIVATGTKDAVRALQSDDQLANRFEPAPLPKWQLDNEYLRLLASFEAMIPLNHPSELIEPGLAAKILSMSGGLIGEMAMILRKAAMLAIKKKVEKINISILDEIGWIAPDDRRRVAERLT